MEHEDRALGSHPVEMGSGQPLLVAEVDRVESADDQRLGRGGAGIAHLLVQFGEPFDQCVVARDPRGDPAEAMTVEPADVREQRERSLEAVRMRLDHAGDEDEFGETIVDLVGTPGAHSSIEPAARIRPSRTATASTTG